MTQPQNADPHLSAPRWTLTGGDVGGASTLPLANRALVQVCGDLMGGKLILDGSLVGDNPLVPVDVIRRAGISEILPVRMVKPSFDGPAEATITVTILGLP